MAEDQKVTRQQFAANVKAKYPSYALVPDDELVTKMLEKYPAYKTRISESPPVTTMKVGLYGGRHMGLGTGREDKDTPDVVSGLGSSAANIMFQGGDIIRRVFGMERVIDRPEVQAAMTPPSTMAGKAGRLVGDIAPYLGPTGVARGLAGRVVREGAKFGAVSAVQTGGDPEDMIASTLLGMATPPVAKAAEAIIRGVFVRLPEKLYTQVFKLAQDDLKLAYQTVARGQPPNPTLAREILDRGLFGSSKNMAVYSVQKLDALERELQTKAGRKILTIPRKQDFIDLLADIEQRFSKGFFSERGAEAGQLRQALVFTKAPVARATDMLKTRRFFDGLRNSSSFRLDPNLAPKQEELKVAADLLRSTIHKQPDLSHLISEERVFIQALDSIITDAVRRGNKPLLNLTDMIVGGGGMASGFPGTGLGAMTAIRAFQQPPTLTALGQGMYRAGKAIPAGAAATVTRATAATGTR